MYLFNSRTRENLKDLFFKLDSKKENSHTSQSTSKSTASLWVMTHQKGQVSRRDPFYPAHTFSVCGLVGCRGDHHIDVEVLLSKGQWVLAEVTWVSEGQGGPPHSQHPLRERHHREEIQTLHLRTH